MLSVSVMKQVNFSFTTDGYLEDFETALKKSHRKYELISNQAQDIRLQMGKPLVTHFDTSKNSPEILHKVVLHQEAYEEIKVFDNLEDMQVNTSTTDDNVWDEDNYESYTTPENSPTLK